MPAGQTVGVLLESAAADPRLALSVTHIARKQRCREHRRIRAYKLIKRYYYRLQYYSQHRRRTLKRSEAPFYIKTSGRCAEAATRMRGRQRRARWRSARLQCPPGRPRSPAGRSRLICCRRRRWIGHRPRRGPVPTSARSLSSIRAYADTGTPAPPLGRLVKSARTAPSGLFLLLKS